MVIKKGQFTDEKTGDVLYPQTSSDMVEGLENNYLRNGNDIVLNNGKLSANPNVTVAANDIWRHSAININSTPPYVMFDINAPRGKYQYDVNYSTSGSSEDNKQFIIELSNINGYKVSIPVNVSMDQQKVIFNIDEDCTKLYIFKSRVGMDDASDNGLSIHYSGLRYLGEEEPVLSIGDTANKTNFMVYKNGDIKGTSIPEQRVLHFTIPKNKLSTRISLPPNFNSSNCFIIGANYWTRLNPYLIDDSLVGCLGNNNIPGKDVAIDFKFNEKFIDCTLTKVIDKHVMGMVLIQKIL